MHPYVFSFAGGLLIGAAVWLLLTGLGRVAGISGIMAATIGQPTAGAWRLAFLAGLIGGGLLFARLFNVSAATVAPGPTLIIAGLLVGFGTVVSGGCTSGHGVCGISRFSKRSILATSVFMATAMLTVFVVRHGGAAWN